MELRFLAAMGWVVALAATTAEAEETWRVSVDTGRNQANERSDKFPAISADGRLVVFTSLASNLVDGDTDDSMDAFVHGPSLILDAEPAEVSGNQPITLTTWTGRPRSPALLVLVDINESPRFLRLMLGRLDAAGRWILAGKAPPSLAGNVLALRTLGFPPMGPAELSNAEFVTFR